VFYAVLYNGLVATGGTYTLVASDMAKFSVSIGPSDFESFTWFSAVCVWLVSFLFFEPNIASPMFIRKDPINFSYYFPFI